jgi:hypothetical protein
MTDAPETRYTRSADGTSLAYQMSGDGPPDLVFLIGSAIPIDLRSEDPGLIRVRRRLDSFSRTLWFDALGVGVSEGDARDTLVGEIFDADVTALLDAAGFERPAMVLGKSPSTPATALTPGSTCHKRATGILDSAEGRSRSERTPSGVPSPDELVFSAPEGGAVSYNNFSERFYVPA